MSGTVTAVMPGAARTQFWQRTLPAAVVILLLALVYARWMTHGQSLFLTSDSILFLYAGQQIAEGAQLYTDVWDHKPPLIFYLNAAGLMAAGGSMAGVVLLQFLFTLAFFALLGAILAPLSVVPKLLAALYGVNLIPALLPGSSNFTEIYGLPIQAFSMYLLLREASLGPRWFYGVAQGALGALLFWLRPNNAGALLVYLSMSALLALRHRRAHDLAAKTLYAAGGFAGVTVLIALPFVLRGALGELIHASVTFNLEYSSLAGLSSRAVQLYNAFINTSHLGLNLVALAAVAWTLIERPDLATIRGRLMAAGVLSLGVEAICSSLSGRSFPHYLLTWTLPLSMLAGVFWWQALPSAERPDGAGRLPMFLVAGLAAFSAVTSLYVLSPRTNWSTRYDRVVRHIQEASSVSDRIMVWGPDRGIYFRSGRKPGSRFFCTVFLGHSRAIYRARAGGILDDIERNAPKFVVEAVEPVSYPLLFAADIARERNWDAPLSDWDDPVLRDRKARLRTRYEIAMVDPSEQAVIYRRVGEAR